MSRITGRLSTALAERYAIEREIGAGGMATVYLADDLKHRRRVAIKVLRPDLADVIGAERFLKEIEVTANLQHPHILPLHDSGEADAFLFYVMPFVDSASLRGVMQARSPLELPYTLQIASEVAGALDYAHRQGVLHRDIKPENILLSEGHAVVADFGIAKAITTAGGENLTMTGWALGTPGYMSPEQATGSPDLDARNDVFSLACVVYEMLTGATPRWWPTDDEVRVGRFLEAPAEHRAILDRYPVTVEQALTRAMAMRPAKRFDTPGEFAKALRAQPGEGATYDTAQVREIVKRATEDEAQHPTDAAPVTIGAVQRIGAEAGIRPERIRDAAASLDSPVHDRAKPDLLLGRNTVVDIETAIGRAITEDEYEDLLAEIRGELGEVGRLNQTLGKSLSWNSLTYQNTIEGSGRLTHVMVKPGNGETRIRITEGGGQQAAFLAAGAAMGGVGAMMIAALLDMREIIVPMAAGGATGAGVIARVVLTRILAKRRKQLNALLERLSRLVSGSD
jgi:serine/threonine protein kinase